MRNVPSVLNVVKRVGGGGKGEEEELNEIFLLFLSQHLWLQLKKELLTSLLPERGSELTMQRDDHILQPFPIMERRRAIEGLSR